VEIDRLMAALAVAGLAHPLGVTLFELHPILTPLLRSEILEKSHPQAREAWTEAFVDVKATIADKLAPLLSPEQERLRSERGNFLVALAEAERSESLEDQFALLQALAVEAQNRNRFTEAGELFRQLVLLHRVRGDERNEAAAYHHLGMIAEEERSWKRAEHWYAKSLALKEKLGDERRAATTCHQLGVIAEERQDPDAAGRWYEKALEIRQRIGDEPGLASTYHQLGILNQKADRLGVLAASVHKADFPHDRRPRRRHQRATEGTVWPEEGRFRLAR
jgi:tetratricopeptide (TPR) repeat protein